MALQYGLHNMIITCFVFVLFGLFQGVQLKILQQIITEHICLNNKISHFVFQRTSELVGALAGIFTMVKLKQILIRIFSTV